jgi:hypothetical protein
MLSEKIALYIEIVEVTFPRTRERRKIYLLDSNYSGKTYVEHVDFLDGLSDIELIRDLVKLSEHEGYSDCLANCKRLGQKIMFEGKTYSLEEIYDPNTLQ